MKKCRTLLYFTPKLAPPNFVSPKGTLSNYLIERLVEQTFRGLVGIKLRQYFLYLTSPYRQTSSQQIQPDAIINPLNPKNPSI